MWIKVNINMQTSPQTSSIVLLSDKIYQISVAQKKNQISRQLLSCVFYQTSYTGFLLNKVFFNLTPNKKLRAPVHVERKAASGGVHLTRSQFAPDDLTGWTAVRNENGNRSGPVPHAYSSPERCKIQRQIPPQSQVPSPHPRLGHPNPEPSLPIRAQPQPSSSLPTGDGDGRRDREDGRGHPPRATGAPAPAPRGTSRPSSGASRSPESPRAVCPDPFSCPPRRSPSACATPVAFAAAPPALVLDLGAPARSAASSDPYAFSPALPSNPLVLLNLFVC